MHKKIVIFTALAATLLSACATAPSKPVKTTEQRLADRGWIVGDKVNDVFNFDIDGWASVDNKHVILSSNFRDSYLVTVMGPCNDLDSAFRLAYTTTAGSLTRGDSLLVHQMGGGIERCPITAINKLSKAPKDSDKSKDNDKDKDNEKGTDPLQGNPDRA